MHCAYLEYLQLHPGYFEWRLRIEFLECAGMEECTGMIPSTSVKVREAEVQSSYSSEVCRMCEIELAYRKSRVE